MSSQNINIQYQTDLFICPYNSAYSDINQVYQGCTDSLPTIGYPCNNYDSNVQKCLSCFAPWIAN